MGWIGDGATAEGDFHSRDDLRRGLQCAGHPRGGQQPVGDLELLRHCRRRARDLRRSARSAMASPACASTAMTRSRSMRRCTGRPSARAPTTGPTLIEFFTYRAEGHSTSDDPVRLPPGQRGQGVAARRPDRAAEGASARARRMGRGAARRDDRRSRRRRSAPRRRNPRSSASCPHRARTTSDRCSRTSTPTCRGTSPSSATQALGEGRD